MIERRSDRAARERTVLAGMRTANAVATFGFPVGTAGLFARPRGEPVRSGRRTGPAILSAD